MGDIWFDEAVAEVTQVVGRELHVCFCVCMCHVAAVYFCCNAIEILIIAQKFTTDTAVDVQLLCAELVGEVVVIAASVAVTVMSVGLKISDTDCRVVRR